MPGFNLGIGLGLGESRAPFARNPIAALFTTGVNGAWYDPSDFSTMFQNAAGTTPVTAVGQPVGLMLDKSKGLVLGSELVTNGDFSNGTTGWMIGANITASVAAGEAVVNFVGSISSTSNNWFAANSQSTANKRYRIEFDATYVSGGDLQAGTDWTVGKTITGASNAGVKTRYSLDVSSQATRSVFGLVTFGSTTTATWKLDNISVRELPGNHAFNGSGNSANFPVLSARYNLLTKTEDFSDAYWRKSRAAVNVNQTVAGEIADKLVCNSSDASFPFYLTAGWTSQGQSSINIASGIKLIVNTLAYIGSRPMYNVRVADGPISNGVDVYYNLQTGQFNSSALIGSGWSIGGTPSITPLSGGWYQLSFVVQTSGSTTVSAWVAPSVTSPSNLECISGVDYGYVHKIDLRVANDALNQPAYQRVNTATDYDTAGFKPYLSFNGVNQWLQTNSIDFTYGDKVFVAAGVRKLSDVAIGAISELSANSDTNAGSFYIVSSVTAGNYQAQSGGSSRVAVATSAYTAPTTNVVSNIGDISAPSVTLRVNGAQIVQSVSSQGTGNYGNYPLYIGSRAGTSLWFNGRLYGLVVAGKAASASEIASTEAWLNSKTGAY